jgi:cystathionine beta-lyase/cystathionine gamma-synthase
MLEENLAYAERGDICVTFATGMAAISAAVGVSVKVGEEILAHRILYGCTYSLFTHWLPRFGIKVRLVDLTDEDELLGAVNEKTRVVYFETPVNPTLQLIDIAHIRELLDQVNAHRKESERILILVDNTFATPVCQRPLELGADLVIQSLTKNIGGFGTVMGGAVIGGHRYYNPLMLFRKDFGGVLASNSAWSILVYGLSTLATRVTNQQKTALHVAQFLERHPKVERVLYPGLETFPQYQLARRQMVDSNGKFAPGSLIYFTFKGDEFAANQAAERFVDFIAQHSYVITLAVSLGQLKTLIETPYTMTHSSLPPEEKMAKGIEPGGVRISIGLEDWHDIIEDLSMAFEQV